jgi:hypothetical protein
MARGSPYPPLPDEPLQLLPEAALEDAGEPQNGGAAGRDVPQPGAHLVAQLLALPAAEAIEEAEVPDADHAALGQLRGAPDALLRPVMQSVP